MAFSLLKPSPWQKRTSLAVGFLSAGFYLWSVTFLLANRGYMQEAGQGLFDYFEVLVSGLIYIPLATLLTYRRPGNPISWLVALFIVLRITSLLRALILVLFVKGVALTPLLVMGINFWPWISGLTFTILAYSIVIFPDGKLPGPRWRPIQWLLGFQVLLTTMRSVIFSIDLFRGFAAAEAGGKDIQLVPMMDAGPMSLALHVRKVPGVEAFFFVTGAVALVMILAGFVSQVVRFRSGRTIVRQQIKWVIYVMILWFFGVVMLLISSEIAILLIFFIGPLPGVAITLAIFRYRLFDIDIIINRTLVYGSLTATLLAVYYGSVVLFESLTRSLTGTDSPLGIVVATLLIAALFQPLRRRLQGVIDRAFFRNKYDAEKTLQAFAATARDEVSIRKLSQALLLTVEDAVQPAHLSLMVRPAARSLSGSAVPEEGSLNDSQRI